MSADSAASPVTPRSAKTLDKSGGRVREMFRQIAPHYDTMNHLLSLNIDRWWRAAAVRKLRLQPDYPVLDVCTGTGDLAIAIKKAVGEGTSVFGSDFCHAMLEIGRKKSEKSPSDQVHYVEADSQTLPFESDLFQCVTVAFGLRNVQDTDQGLREMVRVCRPGGQVMVLEFSKPNVPVLREGYQFYFQSILPRVGQMMARNDKSAYEYLPASVGQFPCGEALAERMRQAGLIDIEMMPLTLGVATIYVGTKPAEGVTNVPASESNDRRIG